MEFRRGKMKSVLYVLLITISSTLLIIVFHLAFSSYGVMEDQLNESDTHRQVMINIDNTQLQLPLQTYMNEFLSNPMIKEVYPYYSDLFGTMEWSNDLNNIDIIVRSGKESSVPKVMMGKGFEEVQYHQVILPSYLQVRQLNQEPLIIDTTNYIGNKIKLHYISEEENKDFIHEGVVVGVYTPDPEELVNYVYVPLEDYYEMIGKKWGLLKENLFTLQDVYSLMIIADQYQNTPKIIEKYASYDEYDIAYNVDIMDDIENINFIKKVGSRMIAIILILTFININMILKNLAEEKLATFALLKAVGYTGRHLFIVILLEVLILVVISYIISIFLSLGFMQVGITFLRSRFFINETVQIIGDMHISYLFYEFILLFLISLLSVIKISIKIKKISTKNLFVVVHTSKGVVRPKRL